MQIKRKGQSIVEFALILPLFLFIFMALIYLGMLFADYHTLSEIARDSARYAAISEVGTTADDIRAKYADTHLLTSVYSWSPASAADFAVNFDQGDEGDKYVEVVLTAQKKDDFEVLGLVLPATISVNCKMRQENQ